MVHKLVVIGVDPIPIVTSAHRAGHKVFAIDHFGDSDLKALCVESLSIIHQRVGESCGIFALRYDVNLLLKLLQNLLERNKVDGAILASGIEDSLIVLNKINEKVSILGNTPKKIAKVRDKTHFFKTLSHLKIPHPNTVIVKGLKRVKYNSRKMGYPIIVKPLTHFGGCQVRRFNDEKSLVKAFKNVCLNNNPVLIQEYIDGIAASASVISSPKKTMALSINEQLLGLKQLGVQESFGYCGNIVPLLTTKNVVEDCKEVAKTVVSYFGLIGSNGVDFIISSDGVPFVIEVNPRFQGSLECVERSLNINLVDAHLKACVEGGVPQEKHSPKSFYTRLILYARHRSVVPDLRKFDGVRDIPLPGVIVEEGEPLCSIISEGKTREASLTNGKKKGEVIFSSLISS